MKPITRKEIVSSIKSITLHLESNSDVEEQFNAIQDPILKEDWLKKNFEARKELLRQLRVHVDALDRMQSKKFFGLF